jgi:hypothetical protein
MPSSAWPDLLGIALPERDPAARAALMRLHVDMFVNAPVRDGEAILAFEMLILGLLPRADATTLAEIAPRLVACEDTPASIIEALAHLSGPLRDIILRTLNGLPQGIVELLLGSKDGRLILAGRPDLAPETLRRLLVLGDDALEAALAANPALRPTDEAFENLVGRGREKPALARVLLVRGDLPIADEAALYLAADDKRRAKIRAGVAATALFHRPHLRFRLSAGRVEELLSAARRGDVRDLEDELTACFGLPAQTRWRVLEAERQELLALALRALGVEEDEAVRIFLTLHPALSHDVRTVFGLVRSFRATARPTALALVEAILGTPTAFARPGRHQPEADPSGTPSTSPTLPADQAARTLAEPRRRSG